MLFGYGGAVIAGFLLTAVQNWAGLATPSGKPLAAPWLTTAMGSPGKRPRSRRACSATQGTAPGQGVGIRRDDFEHHPRWGPLRSEEPRHNGMVRRPKRDGQEEGEKEEGDSSHRRGVLRR
jgi:hypothetical protein